MRWEIKLPNYQIKLGKKKLKMKKKGWTYFYVSCFEDE